MLAGLIPAGGKSQRMGSPKLALPWGESTILAQMVQTLRKSGVDPVLVVLGPHLSFLDADVKNAGARSLLLDRPTADMRETVLQGLNWLQESENPRQEDAWLLVPGDHPLMDESVVRALRESWEQNPGKSIFVPTHEGRRGHPVLFGWEHAGRICALPADQGLNTYIRREANALLEVPVSSPFVLLDIDTPQDYQKAREAFESGKPQS